MDPVKFIPITCQVGNVEVRKFINITHIVEVYQEHDNVVIEYASGRRLILPNQNIDVFMDRFK
jgi:hypothetical protein